MSQSRELRQHIDRLTEIRSILNSLKNLAFMENQKLLRFQTQQNKVVEAIEMAALDFLSFHPYALDFDVKTPHIIILLGAERGFCGDFNESLINEIATMTYSDVITLGSRLNNHWPDTYPKPVTMIEGASVAEEVPAVVNRLLNTLTTLREKHGFYQLTAVYHDNALNRVARRILLPPFQQPTQDRPRYGFPPLLNLDPTDFFTDLLEQYLLAALHNLCYTSLLTENHRRLQHLEGAVKHLDDETVKLRRKSQIYRQEEITEEIEVILLNAENL